MKKEMLYVRKRHRVLLSIIMPVILLALLLGANAEKSGNSQEIVKSEFPKDRIVTVDPQVAIQDFLNSIDEKGTVRTEVYYLSWTAMTRLAVTEESLLESYQYKIVQDSTNPQELKKLFKDVQLTKLENGEASAFCRLSVLFYLEDKVIFRLSFNSNDAIVSVNGQPCLVPFKITDAMLSYLPHREYQHVIKRIEEDWYNLYVSYPMMLNALEQKNKKGNN